MLAILVVLIVYACTFVGCNAKIDGGAKAGFFVVFFLIIAAIALLGWVMG